MELANITFWQVISLFLLIFTGTLCVKLGIVSKESKSALSNLLLYLVLPAMTVSSYMTDYDPDVSRNIFQAFVYSAAVTAISLPLALALNGAKDAPIRRFASIFSNAAYIGFPLIQALYGSEGLIYASAYVTVSNLLLWTVGVGIVSRQTTPREVLRSILKTPVLYAVLVGLVIYYGRVPVPQVFKTTLGYLGGMNTPIAMMITGMLMSSSNMAGILRSGELWETVGVRLLLIPAACITAFFLLGIRGTVAQIVLLLEACPCAAITSVFAVQFHYKEAFAGGLVALSTLVSIITLPACALLLSM